MYLPCGVVSNVIGRQGYQRFYQNNFLIVRLLFLTVPITPHQSTLFSHSYSRLSKKNRLKCLYLAPPKDLSKIHFFSSFSLSAKCSLSVCLSVRPSDPPPLCVKGAIISDWLLTCVGLVSPSQAMVRGAIKALTTGISQGIPIGRGYKSHRPSGRATLMGGYGHQ
jgi:hypothetical protein